MDTVISETSLCKCMDYKRCHCNMHMTDLTACTMER